MKVIMEASYIPLGSMVTKVKGEKRYTIVDKIKIFAGDKPQEIKAEGGARFITSGDGNFNAVNGDVELVWIINADALYDYLARIEGR